MHEMKLLYTHFDMLAAELQMMAANAKEDKTVIKTPNFILYYDNNTLTVTVMHSSLWINVNFVLVFRFIKPF